MKLREFEQLSRQMTQAGPRLQELADQLRQALNGAGVSTAPAMEILRIARWAQRAATDLQRRNRLAHDLDRQNLAFPTTRPDGTYLKLPDRYTDQLAYADGRAIGDLLRRAGTGDRRALGALPRIDLSSINAYAAKAVLETLGPGAVVQVPMDLAQDLRADINAHADGTDGRARDTRAALALLRRSLALATRPDGRAFAGDSYLARLNEAGASTFPPGSAVPNGVAGYQSLATILKAEGTDRFSTAFQKTVGQSMIAYDRSVRAQMHGSPLPDLTGVYDLGNALDPRITTVTPGARTTDFLNPLLTTAAAGGREGAQALLDYREAGPKSKLEYLLSDRRAVWGKTDKGAALGQLVKTATSGRDEDSIQITFAVGNIIANDAPKFFKVDGTELKLKIEDKGALDALSGLRPYMADALARHIVKMNDIYGAYILGADRGSTAMTDAELDYLLLDITRDAGAFEKLLQAQTAHAKVNIDRAVANNPERLTDVVVAEAQIFGHIIEAHNQSVLAEKGRVEAANERLKNLVNELVGLIPVPGAARVGQKAGQLAESTYDTTVQHVFTKIGERAGMSLSQQPNEPTMVTRDNTEAVERLFGQMLTSSIISHTHFDSKIIRDQGFAGKVDPGKEQTLNRLDARGYERLLSWINERFDVRTHQGRAASELANGINQVTGHYRTEDERFNVRPSNQR